MLNGKQHRERIKLTCLSLQTGLSLYHKIHEQALKIALPKFRMETVWVVFLQRSITDKKLMAHAVKPVAKWELKRLSISASHLEIS